MAAEFTIPYRVVERCGVCRSDLRYCVCPKEGGTCPVILCFKCRNIMQHSDLPKDGDLRPTGFDHKSPILTARHETTHYLNRVWLTLLQIELVTHPTELQSVLLEGLRALITEYLDSERKVAW